MNIIKKGIKMKNLLIVVIIIVLFGCACKKRVPIERVHYCMELKLIDGSIVKDTFYLPETMEFEIEFHDGGYFLTQTSQSWFETYNTGVVSTPPRLVRVAVIDYKIENIIP